MEFTTLKKNKQPKQPLWLKLVSTAIFLDGSQQWAGIYAGLGQLD